MKKTWMTTLSTALLVSAISVASAHAAPPNRLECSFGVQGMSDNPNDADAYMEFFHVMIPLKEGTQELGDQAMFTTDQIEELKINVGSAQAGEKYRFELTNLEGTKISAQVKSTQSTLKEIPEADRPSTLAATASMEGADLIGVCALQ